MIQYRYRFQAPDHNTYGVSWVSFNAEKLENFNWNYLDHYVCTRGDTDFSLVEVNNELYSDKETAHGEFSDFDETFIDEKSIPLHTIFYLLELNFYEFLKIINYVNFLKKIKKQFERLKNFGGLILDTSNSAESDFSAHTLEQSVSRYNFSAITNDNVFQNGD